MGRRKAVTVSKLSAKSILSPNHYAGRQYKVTRVTIHEMAAVWSAQRCGEWFAYQTRNASSNYGIGNDGTIMCYVEEQNAAWTSANYDNDNRAITIEVSNSLAGGDWPISDAAYRSLVALCADICTRYGIVPNYNGTPNASFTEHKMFSATACPGPYIHNLLASGKIIRDIRNKMAGTEGELVATKEEMKQIAKYCAEYVWGDADKKANLNMYNALHWAYNNTKKLVERVAVIEKALDDLPKKGWGFKNAKLEKGDAYQILRDTRDNTAKISALEKKVAAMDTKLDAIIKKLG